MCPWRGECMISIWMPVPWISPESSTAWCPRFQRSVRLSNEVGSGLFPWDSIGSRTAEHWRYSHKDPWIYRRIKSETAAWDHKAG